MGYNFTCDDCEEDYNHAPPFMGEIRKSFPKTADSILSELFQPGETVALRRGFMEDTLV